MPNIAALDIESSAPVPPELRAQFDQYQRDMAEFNASPCRVAACNIAACCTCLFVLGFFGGTVGLFVAPKSDVPSLMLASSIGSLFIAACVAGVADHPSDPTAPVSEGP